MSKLAANPAALLHLSLRMVRLANTSFTTRAGCGGMRTTYGVMSGFGAAAVMVDFLHRDTEGAFVSACVCRFVSRLLHGHGFGSIHAPGGNSLFCFDGVALRVTVSIEIFFRKCTDKISPDPP